MPEKEEKSAFHFSGRYTVVGLASTRPAGGPLNAIQSIAKNKKLNEAVLARAAIEVLGGLDKKAQKMLEASLAA